MIFVVIVINVLAGFVNGTFSCVIFRIELFNLRMYTVVNCYCSSSVNRHCYMPRAHAGMRCSIIIIIHYNNAIIEIMINIINVIG